MLRERKLRTVMLMSAFAIAAVVVVVVAAAVASSAPFAPLNEHSHSTSQLKAALKILSNRRNLSSCSTIMLEQLTNSFQDA